MTTKNSTKSATPPPPLTSPHVASAANSVPPPCSAEPGGVISDAALRKAIRHIARHGASDILPWPIETFVLRDCPDEVAEMMVAACKTSPISSWVSNAPFEEVSLLKVSGKLLKRALVDLPGGIAFLGAVIDAAPKIEAARLSPSKNALFSRRYENGGLDGELFDPAFGHAGFVKRESEMRKEHPVVLRADILASHEAVDRGLLLEGLREANVSEATLRVLSHYLRRYCVYHSVGLPVAGDASRMLWEAYMIPVDEALDQAKISFVRSNDNFRIGARSEGDAWQKAKVLDRALNQQGGLALRVSKSLLLTPQTQTAVGEQNDADERQVVMYEGMDPGDAGHKIPLERENEGDDAAAALIAQLNLAYLSHKGWRSLARSLPNASTSSLSHLFQVIFQNVEKAYHVLAELLPLVKGIVPRLTPRERACLAETIVASVGSSRHALHEPLHETLTVRALAYLPAPRAVQGVTTIFARTKSPMVKRDCVLAMARLGQRDWVGSQQDQGLKSNPWHDRAVMVAAIATGTLTQEFGRHLEAQMTPFDRLVMYWIQAKSRAPNWKLPL